MRSLPLVALLCCCLAAPALSQTNLLRNGGMELDEDR